MKAIEIPVIPGPLDATVTIPGSKSITNRALLTAALANGASTIRNALFSEDTHWCSTCLQNLGIPVESSVETFQVQGKSGTFPATHADLFVGNAGTAARFITAMLPLGSGEYHVDGVARMRERPMSDLLNLLQEMGNEITYHGQMGYMPFTLKSNGFRGGDIRLQASKTSQQLSALLMIAPYAQQHTTIVVDGELVSPSYIAMTRRVMEEFGVIAQDEGNGRFVIQAGQRYQPRDYTIEPDASNASYFFAAAAVTGGRVRVNHLTRQSCQGDIRFLNILEQMGCTVNETDDYVEVIGAPELHGVEADMNDISDTVQTLAAIAPFASSPVFIRNVEHIRWKETDRIEAVVNELRNMNVEVEEFSDGMKIAPATPSPATVQTYNDHRMAMAFAVTGLRTPGILIDDPACTAKTFPDFFTRFFYAIGTPLS
jgi:3-phosphoshikimate 1-carboxyvinyltransferase